MTVICFTYIMELEEIIILVAYNMFHLTHNGN